MSINLALVGGSAPKATGKPADRGHDEAQAGRGFDDALANAGRDKHAGVGRKGAAAASRAAPGADQAGPQGYDTSRTAATDADAEANTVGLLPDIVTQADAAVDLAARSEHADDAGGMPDDGADAGTQVADPLADPDAAIVELPGTDAARQTLAMLEAFITSRNQPAEADPAGKEGSAKEPAPDAGRSAAHFGKGAWNIGIASAMPALRMGNAIPAGNPLQSLAAAQSGAAVGGKPGAWTRLGVTSAHASVQTAAAQVQAAGQPAAPSPDAMRPGFQSISGTASAAPPQTITPGVPAPSGETPTDAEGEIGRAEGSDKRAQFEPLRSNGGKSSPMADDGKASARTPDAVAGRVNVVSYSAALAPAPAQSPALGSTATGLVTVFEADPTWRAAAADAGLPAGQRSQMPAQSVNTLRIQLQPAELGMVTARLTATGSQLSIEIQAESNDARQRLANDSEAIVKALRGIGYDIDRVTIQQAPQASAGTAAQGGATARDPGFAEQQARGETDARGQGGRESDNRKGEGARHGPVETAAQRAGGGVYI